MATQRMKHFENERNYFEMAQELALAILSTRNKELTLSLEVSLLRVLIHKSGHNWIPARAYPRL